jgi:hypothetical protein
MAALTVDEAAGTYEDAMINIAPAGSGVCATCRTFHNPNFDCCYPCGHQPSRLDAVVPITYSVDGEAVHHALRWYKDGVDQVRRYAAPRLAAILWRFLERHEPCVARSAGAQNGFGIVTTVPSSTPERDAHSRLRWVAEACGPIADRLQRVIGPTGDVPTGREYDERRYQALADIHSSDVLLIDDTWTAGGHAQSAAHTLREAGAQRIGLVVLGRHIHRDRDVPNSDTTNDALLRQLPKRFDWSTCAVHVA